MAGPWEKYGGTPTADDGPWAKYGGDSAATPAPTKPAAPVSRMDKFEKGLRDPIDGGAQLLTKMLPDGVVKAGNEFNNWLADKAGLVGRLPEGGVDQQVRENEADYQAKRAAGGESGFDGYRVAGNVFNPANVALASRAPAALTIGGRVAAGAGGGAVSGMLNPVTGGDDFASEKAKQVATGAAFGGAVPLATSALARLVKPNASSNAQLATLRAEGVRPTVGQTLGGLANTVEEKATSIPVVGDMIASARRGAAADLNRAAFNRALKPVGAELPKGAVGRDAVQFTEDAISDGYNALLPSLSVRADKAFVGDIQNLRSMVNTGAIDPNAAKTFNRIIQNDVLGKFQGQNALTGQTYKAIESDLGAQIKRFASSQDSDQRLVGDALQEVQASMRKMLERSNPSKASELSKLNTAWANFKRVQKASASLGAEDGVFTPAQLQSAIKALDRSKDKAGFSRGDALMQDLGEAGKSVLGSKVPDSGTAGRVFLGAGAGAGAFLDPSGVTPLLLGGGAAAYSRPAQNALTALIANRPQGANAIASALRKTSPALAPAAAQIGLGLRD